MPRHIVYPTKGATLQPESAAGAFNPDEFGDKLVKYLPAEVIAFYVPIYALIPAQEDWARLVVLVIGILGTVGYLLVRTPKGSSRWYFYLLAALAFIGWALGTSSVGQDLMAWPEWATKFILLLIVFAVPLADELITRYWQK